MYGTVRTVVWEDGGREPPSYPITTVEDAASLVDGTLIGNCHPPAWNRAPSQPWTASAESFLLAATLTIQVHPVCTCTVGETTSGM